LIVVSRSSCPISICTVRISTLSRNSYVPFVEPNSCRNTPQVRPARFPISLATAEDGGRVSRRRDMSASGFQGWPLRTRKALRRTAERRGAGHPPSLMVSSCVKGEDEVLPFELIVPFSSLKGQFELDAGIVDLGHELPIGPVLKMHQAISLHRSQRAR